MPQLPLLWYLAPLGALASLASAYLFFRGMKAQDPGNQRMVEIAGFVREGAFAYLRQQYAGIGIFFAVALVIFLFLAHFL